MTRRVPLAPLLLCLALLVPLDVARAAVYEITVPGGGDCQTIGGIWILNQNTCLLFGFELDELDTLRVLGATARFSGISTLFGAFDNEGTVEVTGTLHNRGTYVNRTTTLVTKMLVNDAGGVLTNRPAASFFVSPAAAITNAGAMVNQGGLSLQINEAAGQRARLDNTGTLANESTIDGSATQGDPGSPVDNQGSIDNTGGMIRNAHVDNRGSITGGLIDDTGGAQAAVLNRHDGSIDGATITKVALENFGLIDHHTFGSGTIVNHSGATIRAVGGQTFAVFNSGLVEALAGFEMFNTFTNEAGGVLINRGTMTSHARLRNEGVFENRGPWLNDGAALDQGVIENPGTLLNFDTILACTSAPDTEELRNTGTVVNSGTISACGSDNSGSWYECGDGEAPAGNPVIADVDSDGDGVCDLPDCANLDASQWAPPSEVTGLTLARLGPGGPTAIAWSHPLYLGGDAVLADVLGSPAADDFAGAGSCLESGITGNTVTDATAVDPGQTLFVLVRATSCEVGTGGTDSSGVSRSLPACP